MITLDKLILASKKFHTFGFIIYFSYFDKTSIYNIYKNKLKLATFKISYIH